MNDIVTSVATTVSIAASGGTLMILALIHPMFKARRRRAVAELRRQARAYEARLAEQERAHAAEVSALKEHIRYDREKMRPHDAVARSIIHKTPILNKSEFRLYERLRALVANLSNSERLFAQVALVEVFAPRSMNGCKDTRRAAFEAYGTMRCDFVIVDRAGYAICGIEYQGTGHHQANFAYREQIKREVFRKAGVPLVEIGNDDSWADTEMAIRAALRAPLLAA
jgi:hypothetical protein